jgi:uncharacterized protein (DUF2236 family)
VAVTSTDAERTLDAVVEGVRQRVGGAVRGLILGEGEGGLSAFAEPLGDPGLLGPDSVAWRMHADIAGLIGGLRALLLQTMHPLAMAGVAEHSDYRQDPWGRLHRTASFVATSTYGGTEAANRSIQIVREVHARVRGVAPDGRSYEANDPKLLLWVHATEVDSFISAVTRYGSTPLDRHDIDRYLEEMAKIACALGAEDVPVSQRELRAYWRDVRPELKAGAQARETARFLVVPPVPLWARPAYAVVTGAAVGLLPRFVRRALWLPSPPLVEAVAVRPAAAGLVKLLGWSMGASPAVEAAHQRMSVDPPAT